MVKSIFYTEVIPDLGDKIVELVCGRVFVLDNIYWDLKFASVDKCLEVEETRPKGRGGKGGLEIFGEHFLVSVRLSEVFLSCSF